MKIQNFAQEQSAKFPPTLAPTHSPNWVPRERPGISLERVGGWFGGKLGAARYSFRKCNAKSGTSLFWQILFLDAPSRPQRLPQEGSRAPALGIPWRLSPGDVLGEISLGKTSLGLFFGLRGQDLAFERFSCSSTFETSL